MSAESIPDLGALAREFQILTELEHSGDTRIFLARHLELNRDVTIEIVRAEGAGGTEIIKSFASDARLLSILRHANVVPVLEGRQLDEQTFAIVRPRVRGTTMDHLVSASTAIPDGRVGTILEQVNSALAWARENGIANRHVSLDAVVEQQGSGRALVSFDRGPIPAGQSANACDDARTIGQLAWEMLGGLRQGSVRTRSLAAARPDLSPRIIRETEALMYCDRNGRPRDPSLLISLLVPAAVPAEPEPAVGLTPLHELAATEPVRVAAPVNAGDDQAVVVVKRGFGFTARLLTAAAVAAVVLIIALFVLHRNGASVERTASGSTRDSGLAGDVAPRSVPDTGFVNGVPTPMPIVPAPAVAPGTVPPIDSSAIVMRMSADSLRRARDSVLALRDSLTRSAQATRDSLARAARAARDSVGRAFRDSVARAARDTTQHVRRDTTRLPNDSAKIASAEDICASPAGDDQRACLSAAIRRNDSELNSVYTRLIAAVRRQANVSGDDPDPPAVEEVRAAQRKFLEERESACEDVGQAPRYARARAACFAEQSARRTRELRQQLSAISPN